MNSLKTHFLVMFANEHLLMFNKLPLFFPLARKASDTTETTSLKKRMEHPRAQGRARSPVTQLFIASTNAESEHLRFTAVPLEMFGPKCLPPIA